MILRYAHSSAEQKKRAVEGLNRSVQGSENLRKIFEKVRSGEMDFDDFERAILEAKFSGGVAG